MNDTQKKPLTMIAVFRIEERRKCAWTWYITHQKRTHFRAENLSNEQVSLVWACTQYETMMATTGYSFISFLRFRYSVLFGLSMLAARASVYGSECVCECVPFNYHISTNWNISSHHMFEIISKCLFHSCNPSKRIFSSHALFKSPHFSLSPFLCSLHFTTILAPSHNIRIVRFVRCRWWHKPFDLLFAFLSFKSQHPFVRRLR